MPARSPLNFLEVYDFLDRFGAGSQSAKFGNVTQDDVFGSKTVNIPQMSAVTGAPDNQMSQALAQADPQLNPEETVLVDEKGNKLNSLLNAIGTAMIVFSSNDPGQTFAALQGQKLRDAQIAQELAESQRQHAEEIAFRQEDLDRRDRAQALDTFAGMESQRSAIEASEREAELNRTQSMEEIEARHTNALNLVEVQAGFDMDTSIASIRQRAQSQKELTEFGHSLDTQREIASEQREIARNLVTEMNMDLEAAQKIAEAFTSEDFSDLTHSQAIQAEIATLRENVEEKDRETFAKQIVLSGAVKVLSYDTTLTNGKLEQIPRTSLGTYVYRDPGYAEAEAIAGGANPDTVGMRHSFLEHMDRVTDPKTGGVRTNPDGSVVDDPGVQHLSREIDGERVSKLSEDDITTSIIQWSEQDTPGKLSLVQMLVKMELLKEHGLSNEAYERGKLLLDVEIENQSRGLAERMGITPDVARRSIELDVQSTMATSKMLDSKLEERHNIKGMVWGLGNFLWPISPAGGKEAANFLSEPVN